MEIETHYVCGVEIRVTDVVPEEIIGVNNGRYLVYFWQGAEVAKIHPNKSLHANTNLGVGPAESSQQSSFLLSGNGLTRIA